MNVRTIIGAGACALVLAGLGLGFSAIGSPTQNRLRAADARVQQAVYDIAHETAMDASSKIQRSQPVYPAALEADLRRSITFENRSRLEYALCATFNETGNEFARFGTEAPTWKHSAGRYCYRFHRRHLASDGYQTAPLP